MSPCADMRLGHASRAASDAECKAEGLSGEPCIDHILERELVTPVSIARDPDFEKIYSNYPI